VAGVGLLSRLPLPKEPKVCIVVVNWKGLSDTVECIRSLGNISYSNYEIVIVDNASKGDDVIVFQREFGNFARIIQNDKNYGFAIGINIGIKYALRGNAQYVLLLHNDTVVEPSFLTELVKVAEHDQLVGIAGSRIYNYWTPDADFEVRCAGKINWWIGDAFVLGKNFAYDKFVEVDFVSELGLLVKRQVLEKVGLLNETFFMHRLDYDFCTRARKQGFKVVFVPSSKIWHKYGATRVRMLNKPSTPIRTLLLSSVNHFRFLWKHSSTLHYPSQLLCFFIFVLPRFALGATRQPRERIYLGSIIKMLIVKTLLLLRKP